MDLKSSSSFHSGNSNTAATARPISRAKAPARSKIIKGVGSGSSGGCKIPNILRRKIRERLIHLLALKPFKKPVIYLRLQKEGILEKERSQIMTTLRDIATLSSDNTYNLRRPMWKEVNEYWPYYSEEEQQHLKRHKLQNLTSSSTSDSGSSTYRQSQTSTNTGSAPPLVGNGGSGLKIISNMDDNSDVKAKKRRISHFNKNASSARIESGSNSKTIGDADSGYPSQTINNSYCRLGGAGIHQNSVQQKQQTSARCSWSLSSSSKTLSSTSGAPTTPPAMQVQHALQHQQHSNFNQQQKQQEQKQNEPPMNASPMQQITNEASASAMAQSLSQTQESDLSNYDIATITRITTIEQRRHCKAVYESDYDEYRKLKENIECVSLRFRRLAECLEQAGPCGSDSHTIGQQIVSECERIRNHEALQQDKSRFFYLHNKLSHIKQLIADYDQSLTS